MENVLPSYLYDIKQVLSLIKYNMKTEIKLNYKDPVQLQELYEFLDELLNLIEFMSAYKLVDLKDEQIKEIKDKIKKNMELISEAIDKLVYEA